MKKTQIGKALEALDADISVLMAVRARLMAMQVKVAPRRPRAVKPKAEGAA